MPVTNNFKQVHDALTSIADNWDTAVVEDLFSYVGDLAVQEMQNAAPVDTGALKAAIKKTQSTKNTVTIECNVPYAVPVDQGHRTRSGSFVEAQPFFSGVVGEITGGELIKQARVKMKDHIEGTFSHYKGRV